MRDMSKKIRVGGNIVEVTTICGMAKIIGRSRSTVLRWERKGLFPPAPFRVKNYRYYPIALCKEVAKLVHKFKPNKTPSAELITQVNKLYKEEIDKYA